MSDERPVLNALREILKFKDYATVSEVAKFTGLRYAEALRRINKNGSMVWRGRQTGRITRVDPREILREKLWKAGAYYIKTTHDYGATHGLDFVGHDEIRKRLMTKTWGGGFGDSYQYGYIPDTPENRVILEQDGCVSSDDIVLDDSLWVEP